MGDFEVVPLEALRERVRVAATPVGRLRVGIVEGDVRKLHRAPEYAGALFQVASQYNMLEMTGPDVTPERGVTRYESDHTQGPPCAIAAGAATIYRNYFAPVDGVPGQTAKRQLDGLAPVGEALGKALGKPVGSLWRMRNGYAMCSTEGLDAIATYLATSAPTDIDKLRSKLCVGLQRDVEVTEATGEHHKQLVSQIFCSALPVAYSRVPSSRWRRFASLVLEAAYEATMSAAVLNARRGASNVVLLTLVGGSAFGNATDWILDAMRRALEMFRSFEIEARIVSYGAPSPELIDFADGFGCFG